MAFPRNAAVVALLLLVAGCGLRPAQDYAAIGSLTVADPMKRFIVAGQRMGGEVELVMTLRTSPKVEDVIVQRRWINPTFPFEFGLGKGRGEALKGRKVYVTAELSGLPVGSLVGFTEEAQAVPLRFIDLQLAHQSGDPALLEMPGCPQGGFRSETVQEEATPPGREPFMRGPRVFAGRLEIPRGYEQKLAGLPVVIISRPKPDRTAPDLYTKIERPSYPLDFSLHQNDRIQAFMGQRAAAVKKGQGDPVTWSSYVVAQIDLDGSVDTKDDLIEAVSAKVEPGTMGVVLRFDPAEIDRVLGMLGDGGRSPAGSPHGGNPHGGSGGTAPVAGLVAQGRVELPPELAAQLGVAGGDLWLSIRDPESQQMLDAHRFSVSAFPFEFALENGKGSMQRAFAAGQKFMLRAILAGDPSSKTAPIATSGTIEPGASGLVLKLAAQ
ncbi:MAG: hypothetical protein H6807_02155 [Planctomycetes bacterium]|nr:hypothetical protein [Planctomycetota bacterium]